MIERILQRCWCALAPALLSGCVGLTTYNKTRSIDDQRPQATYIDAKQRAIFSSPAYDDQLQRTVLKFCAEPSPDALSALAASGNGGLSYADKATLQAAFAVSESSSSIGLRTQSIQLMRDSMFRLCEAAMSHNFSPEFLSAYRYFQNSMVSILAIEQLTGVVKAASAQLATTATATPSKDVAALSDSLTKAKTDLATETVDANAKKKAFADATDAAAAYLKSNSVEAPDKLPDDKKDGYTALKQKLDDAQKANDAAAAALAGDQKMVDTYQSVITELGTVALTATGTATAAPATLGASSQGDVAGAVRDIVLEQLRGGFFRETCATLYDREVAGTSHVDPNSALHRTCDAFALRTVLGQTQGGNGNMLKGTDSTNSTDISYTRNNNLGVVLRNNKLFENIERAERATRKSVLPKK